MSVLHVTTATLQAFPFNSGRTQAAGQPNGGDFPFVDHFKNGQGFGGAAWVDPATLDDDGWPNTLPQALTNFIYIPSQAERPGRYIVDWLGNGIVSVSGGTVFSGSLSGNNGSAVITPTGGATNSITIGISALVTKITRLRLYHEDDAGVIDTQVFGTAFLNMLRAARFGVIRHLDNGPSAAFSGQGNVTTWAMRKPPTYAIWAAREPKASVAMGTASYALNGSSNDYSKTYGDSVSGPVHGETIILKVANTATNTTCTFNKNGTGAISMRRANGQAFSSTNQTPLINTYMVLIYDSGFNAWLQSGGNVNDGSLYIKNGWPVEVCLELCKTVGAHPHFVMPYLSLDPITDFASSLASYIRTNYQNSVAPWMVPRFEGPNELWNNQFVQTAYADARQIVRNGSTTPLSATAFSSVGSGASGTSTIKATGASIYSVGSYLFVTGFGGVTGFNDSAVYVTAINVGGDPDTVTVNRAPTSGTWTSGGTMQGQSGDRNNWYGRVMSSLGQAVAGVWSVAKANVHDVATATTKYQVLCGVQTSTTPSSSDDRLSAAQYVRQGGDAASDWVNVICNAQYHSPSERGTPTEVGRAYQYSLGDLTQATSYVDTLAGAAAYSNLNYVSNLYSAWKTWAQGFSIQRMCGYEGGYSPDYVSTAITATISAATKDATGCTLTLSASVIESSRSGTCFDSNCVGMTFAIASVAGMTQLNGLTPTILSVSGNNVKINVDSSGFSTYTSGGTITVTNGVNLLNALRYASKLDPHLEGYTTTNITNFTGLTGGGFTAEFPSFFLWSGSSYNVNIASPGSVGVGQVWPVLDPDIYASYSPQFEALKIF